MKNSIFLYLLLLSFLACSTTPGEEEEMDPKEPNEPIDLAKIQEPCLDNINIIDLPAALQIQENYSKYDVTQQLFDAVQENKVSIESFSIYIDIPETATKAKVDDINVYEGEEAFQWEANGHKYMLKLQEEGWQTYYFETPSKVFGARLSKLTQNEVCSQFHYDENEVTGDNIGEIKFSYYYVKVLGADQVEWEYDLYDPSSERHRIRQFDDGGGDYFYYVGDVITLSMIWQPSGDGTYKKFEEGVEVDSGTFSF